MNNNGQGKSKNNANNEQEVQRLDRETTHKHLHCHSPEHKKVVLNRLAKTIGHLDSVRRMIEDDRDCSEVLLQLLAVKSALDGTGKCILKEHLSHCIVDAIEHGDLSAIEDLNKVIEYFM